MTAATFDKSRLLPLYARINEIGVPLIITFLDAAGNPFDISGFDWKLPVKRKPTDSDDAFELSLNDGLTIQGASNHQLKIELSQARSQQRNETYFYRLYDYEELHTWLNGPFRFHNGEFDGTQTTETITVSVSGADITLTVETAGSNITAATQDEMNAGTPGGYAGPDTIKNKDDDAVALDDAATIDITGPKHTLTTASSRTFTISHLGDCIIIDMTLSATSATPIFPATSLCYYNGTASGDNTLPITGAVSGDHIMIGILKFGSNYRVTAINIGQ